jgi:hypothetical protein
MPGHLLHLGATVMCLHGGQATPTQTSPHVTVSGCSLSTLPVPPPFCVTAQWVTAATRVTADSVPVLLEDSQAVCTASGTGLNVVTTQTRVKGT